MEGRDGEEIYHSIETQRRHPLTAPMGRRCWEGSGGEEIYHSIATQRRHPFTAPMGRRC